METTNKLDLTDDVIDVRDIIARIEELEVAIEAYAEKMGDWQANADNTEELETLTTIMAELAGNGGDEEWRGDWYPVTLIRDSYFTDYARELLEDCGDIPRNLPDYIKIDWDATAENIRVDYTACEINGVTYWYR